MGNKVIKSVSFNMTVADDKSMLKHFSRRNFSGYVKKLIMEDMKKNGFIPASERAEIAVIESSAATAIPTAREQIEKMKQQRNSPPLITKPKH